MQLQGQRSSTASSATKSVTFADTAKMRLTLHLNRYTSAEIASCYYSSEDFRAFKLDVKRTIRMVEMKRAIDQKKDCMRGAVCHTKESASMRFRIRRDAQSAVLEEQLNQDKGAAPRDYGKIAAKYAPISGGSAVKAYVVGLSDAAVAKELEVLEENEQWSETRLLDVRGSNSSRVKAFKLPTFRKQKEEQGISMNCVGRSLIQQNRLV